MKRLTYIFLMLSLVVFYSCDSLLDKKPLDKFTNSNYWTSEAKVEVYANTFFNEFAGYGVSFDNTTLNDNQAGRGFTNWNYTSVPASHGTWNNSYTEIRRANFMIEQVPNISSMSESAKANWIGIARLYRAWHHYKIVRKFGDCLFVDKPLTESKDDKDNYLFAARQDRDTVMNKVLDDLEYAVNNITADASSRVAFNNALANAIKAEICLFEGTFCKYRSSSDGQKAADKERASKYLTAAKTACQEIMGNSMYELSDTYQENYNSLDLKDNKEVILYKKYVYGTMSHSTIAYTSSSTMQEGMTKDAFDSYLFLDGKPASTTTYDNTDKFVKNSKGELSIVHMLSVRDKRLSQTVDSVILHRGNAFNRFEQTMATTSSTGYGVLKFDNPIIPVDNRVNDGRNETDAPLFWLAETYLAYAEACAELGTCTNNDLDISVNKLRERAGLPKLTINPDADPANNHGVSNLIWEIRRERRVELMFDKNDRYWSLVRWHQLDKLDSKKYPNVLKGAWVGDADKAQATITADGYVDASNGASREYHAKYYLDPIPSGQIDLNENLGQNYGW